MSAVNTNVAQLMRGSRQFAYSTDYMQSLATIIGKSVSADYGAPAAAAGAALFADDGTDQGNFGTPTVGKVAIEAANNGAQGFIKNLDIVLKSVSVTYNDDNTVTVTCMSYNALTTVADPGTVNNFVDISTFLFDSATGKIKAHTFVDLVGPIPPFGP